MVLSTLRLPPQIAISPAPPQVLALPGSDPVEVALTAEAATAMTSSLCRELSPRAVALELMSVVCVRELACVFVRVSI